MYHKIDLNIKLTDTVTALYADANAYGPIILITLVDGKQIYRTRLDTDKKMFIDATPPNIDRKASAIVLSDFIEASNFGVIQICKDRQLYRLSSRNLSFGVYSEITLGFFGLRTKFGDRFVDQEYMWDPYRGTALPLSELTETLPEEILLSNSLGSVCDTCGVSCAYIHWPEGGFRAIEYRGHKSINVRGEWKHLEETDCSEIAPVNITNTLLENWLLTVESKYSKVQ